MDESLRMLKKQISIYKKISLFAVLLCVVLGIYVFWTDSQSAKILKTQGIIVTDSNGNDRILIGAPIPYSSDRVRTDSAMAWETYIEKFPEHYREKVWNWYEDYNHSSNGIVFLNESGIDRIVIGDPTPDPAVGKRNFPGTGIILNDEEGFERSGYGIMKTGEESYRVGLGLDSKEGTEGLMLELSDDGINGIIIPGNERFIFLGNADTTFFATQPYPKYNGLMIRNMDSVFVDVR